VEHLILQSLKLQLEPLLQVKVLPISQSSRTLSLCDIPDDKVLVELINQQKWTKLFHVTTIGIDKVKDFYATRRDGNFEAKPMMIHICIFKCFLLFYKRTRCEGSSILTEADVMNFTKTAFHGYCGSDDYAVDLASYGMPQKRSTSHKQGGL
jgi:hypothetical protein